MYVRVVFVCFILAMNLVKSSPLHRESRDDGPFDVEETMFHAGVAINFVCSESNDPRHVRWFLDGYPIEDIKDDSEEYGWEVNSVQLNLNTISLIPQPGFEAVSTLLCKIEDQYPNNIANMWHLVKAVHRKPSAYILGRHARTQICPMLRGKTLTISCTAGLRYIAPHSWSWLHNDRVLPGATEGQIRVSEPGKYECLYNKLNGGERELLEFEVMQADETTQGSDVTWQFCSYKDHVNSRRHLRNQM